MALVVIALGVETAREIFKDYQTLLGAVIGSIAIGYQVSRGFRNQIEAQKHAADVSHAARLHEAEIQKSERVERRNEDAKILASSLRGELTAAHQHLINRHSALQLSFTSLAIAQAAGQTKFNIAALAGFDARLYVASIDRLGLLNASLVGDVAKVYPRIMADLGAFNDLPVKFGKQFCETLISSNNSTMNDVHHVAMRLRDFEWGDPLRDSLIDRDVKLAKSATNHDQE